MKSSAQGATKAKAKSKTRLTVVHRKNVRADLMPDLFKVKFFKPYRMKKSRRAWNIKRSEYSCPGFIVARQGNIIVDIRYADYSVYYQVLKLIIRDPFITSIGIIKLPKGPKKTIRNRISRGYNHLLKQWHRIPTDSTYKKISAVLARPSVTKKDVMPLLTFRPPYMDLVTRKRVCTYGYSEFRHKSGCYIYRRDKSEIVYVGRSVGGIYRRLNVHNTRASGVGKDRPQKQIAKFCQEIEEGRIDIAVIHIPGIVFRDGKLTELTFEEETRYSAELESLLGKVLKPTVNFTEKFAPLPQMTNAEKLETFGPYYDKEAPF